MDKIDPAKQLELEENEESKKSDAEVAEEKDATNNEVVNAIKEVKEALSVKPGAPPPTREEIREALKEKSGFTDAQLDVMEQLNLAGVKQSSTKVSELQEKVAWAEFKDEHGGKIDPAVDKIMKEELKQYDAELRGDKVLLKKVFYLAKGILAEKQEKQRKADPNSNDKVNDADNIVGRQIVNNSGNLGSSTGLENDGKKGGNGPALSDDEKVFAKKMRISEEDYAESKKSVIVGEHKPKAVFRGA